MKGAINKKLKPIIFGWPPNKTPINIEIAYDIKNIFFWNKSMFFNILKVAVFKLLTTSVFHEYKQKVLILQSFMGYYTLF